MSDYMTEINLEHIKNSLAQVTHFPWYWQENEDVWQLFGGQQGHMQILKAPKRNTDYAEYWPKTHDSYVISNAPTWLASLITTIESQEQTIINQTIERDQLAVAFLQANIKLRESDVARSIWTIKLQEAEQLIESKNRTIKTYEEVQQGWLDSHAKNFKQIESQKEEISRLNYLRPEVQWFAEQMEFALRANDHKGTWKECTDFYLLSRMKEEYMEVSDSLFTQNRNRIEVVKECADVANFALMIADNARLEEGEK